MITATPAALDAYAHWRDRAADGPLDLSVVIPAYNEQERIVATIGAFAAHLAATPLAWELIVSDDGSTDATRELVRMLGHVNIRVIGGTVNEGKGAAVRRGILAARGTRILFADADNATPAGEITALLARIDGGADVAIGSRSAIGADVANRSRLRSVLTGGLRWVQRAGLGIRVRDTQCGFKLFTTDAARRIAAAQTVEGFAFDLEVLYLAGRFGYDIAEVPVRWFDAPGSKVRAAREVLRFLGAIAGIRRNAMRGVYRDA